MMSITSYFKPVQEQRFSPQPTPDQDSDQEDPLSSGTSEGTVTESGESTDQCTSECCDEDLSAPYQPKELLSTRRKQGKQSRVFQATWFDEHKWLTFCVRRNKAYCYCCHAAVARGLVSFNKKGKSAFVTAGFDNWKKAKERFKEHERCQVHYESCMKLVSSTPICCCQTFKPTCERPEIPKRNAHEGAVIIEVFGSSRTSHSRP